MNPPVDYLSGPMSGKPYFNIPAFDDAAADLRRRGRKVVSPAELDDPEFRALCLLCETGDIQELKSRCRAAGIEPATWGDLLARDIKLLANDGIENIVCLSGWTKSQGARGETFFGRLLNLAILSYPSLRPVTPGALSAAHGWPDDTLPVGSKQFIEHPPIPSAYIEDNETVHLTTAGKFVRETPKQKYDREMCEGQLRRDFNQERRESPSKDHARAVQVPRGYSAQTSPIVPATTGKGEVRVTDPTTGGEKGEKPEAFDLLPWEALDEVAKLYHRGAKKYEPNNWRKGFRWGLCFASLIRHAHAFWRGESLDPETKCHHLASVAFHALTLIEFEKHKLGTDDRPAIKLEV